MKIVFLSDTHGSLSELKNVALREYDADAYFHLGDVLATPSEILPFVAVKGNCDPSYFAYPPSRTLVLPSGKRLYMRHHPLGEEEAVGLREGGYSYFLHGHTHRREDRLLAPGLRSLCPGSPSFPRDEIASYLVLFAFETGEAFEFKTV